MTDLVVSRGRCGVSELAPWSVKVLLVFGVAGSGVAGVGLGATGRTAKMAPMKLRW